MNFQFSTALMPLVCSLSLPASGVTLINGSFESSTGSPTATVGGGQQWASSNNGIDGWTISLDGVERFQPASFGLGPAPDGVWVLDLAYFTSTTGGGVFQVVATVPNEAFTLDFSASTARSSGRDGTAEIQLLIDDVLVRTISLNNPLATMDWQEFSEVVTPISSSTKIEFRNMQDANLHFAYLDGANVVPEPSSILFVGLAGLSLIVRRRDISLS